MAQAGRAELIRLMVGARFVAVFPKTLVTPGPKSCGAAGLCANWRAYGT